MRSDTKAISVLDTPRYRGKVKLTGLGIRAVVKTTNKLGQATFKVRPKKKGNLLVSATKAGFQAAYGSLRVR